MVICPRREPAINQIPFSGVYGAMAVLNRPEMAGLEVSTEETRLPDCRKAVDRG